MLKNSLVADDGSLNLEMALIIALLVLVAAVTLFALGNAIAGKFSSATTTLGGVTVPTL